MHTLEQLNEKIVEHNQYRRHFDRTPEELALQIREEAQELVDEIVRSLLTGEIFNIVGEVGDIYILLAQFCSQLGINPLHAVEAKVLRNERKYPDYSASNGYTKEEYFALSKLLWKRQGADVAFSYVYLDFLAEVDDSENADGAQQPQKEDNRDHDQNDVLNGLRNGQLSDNPVDNVNNPTENSEINQKTK